MRKLQKSRISILLTLLMISTLLIVFNYLPTVLAGPDIPEESQYNGWHWGVDVDDKLYFEAEFTVENFTTGEVVAMFRDIWIYNISSIENVTMEWLGIHEFSVVNASRCYYDPITMEIHAWTAPEEYAIFNYNETDPINHRYRAGFSGIPQILPLNNSALELDILAPVINETMYDPLSDIMFNQYDSYEYNLVANSMRFDNSTDGYFAYAEYYGNNGTLKYAKTSMLANMGTPMVINATFQRVFDYDITDEVEWGVNVGDSVTIDLYEGGDPDDAYDLKFTVTNITDINVPTPFNSFNFEESIPMAFQVVFANVSVWNGIAYEVVETGFPMGAANNFYPMFFEGFSPPELLLIIPTSASIEDLEFLMNPDKLRIYNAPLDTIEINDGTSLEFSIFNSTGHDFINGTIDKATGLYEFFVGLMEGDLVYYEQKSSSLVDWFLDSGDTFYYKVNEDDSEDRIVRATILGTELYFLNVSMLEYESGGLYTVPSGQPEFQFFSGIKVDLDLWNATSETWYSMESDTALGIANIYWPLSPLVFGEGSGFPLLFPTGVQGSDFSGLFNAYSTIFDDINFGNNYVTLVNTTLDRQLDFHFDSTSGILTYLGGWVNQPGGDSTDWSYTSVYPLNIENLTSGVSSFDFESDFVINIDLSISLNLTSAPFEYLYALFPFNPVNVPLPNGTALCYLDQITSHPSLVSGNITMTVTFPMSINLGTTDVYLFAWNVSGSSTWEIAPPESYEISLGTNSIIIFYGAYSADSTIFAISYKPPPSSGMGIPGYDPFLIIIGLTMVATILVKLRKKKKY